MRILFAAGGTAGHVNPALAIADKVREVFPESDSLFVGTQNGLESKLIQREGYAFSSIKASGFQRKITFRNIGRNAKAVYHFVTAGKASKKIISDFSPDIVVGTGGYVSAPVLSAAAELGIKTVVHESNSLPGMATKMLAKSAEKVFLSSERTLSYFPEHSKNPKKYVVTGNPLRFGFRTETKQDRKSALDSLGLDSTPGVFTILSVGGSLGANSITEAVARLLKWERDSVKDASRGGINHIHAYGGNGRGLFEKLLVKNDIQPIKGRNIFAEYIHNMYTCMMAADLVICRAGSMTQTELMAFGRASVQIPWAGASENHQYFNALTMKEAGAAILIKDEEDLGDKLIDAVSALYNQPSQIHRMEKNAAKMSSPNAAGVIVSEMLDLL
ncbi:MAG: UDP-N-acetylglucosamine--N-acetylmuramyl-(pentapeptide) pyrophosphoryl-undecaprenol N-acetylglucosamine transferase [Oscillospiraceae bacterium]|nr:UDP-N-acetylglucosamine--N-acetylmuramyl-(pentapeptide) pyrophosphoryl-undecaprenol N-acetylglucosamine transferase [Oscillospiraceae bacterium]